MPRGSVSDVIPPSRRKIRKEEKDGNDRPETPRHKRAQHGTSSSLWMWIIAVLGVGAILFLGFSFLFSGAKVTAVPRQERVNIDGTFNAKREVGTLALTYEVMELSKEGTRTVTATGEEQVDTKASGKIVVYNNYNSATQRLIKNTRFETSDGLIFRIPESIDVPGRHENEKGETVPGSIEVTVYADTSGDEYNIGLSDFTIPGFKGDPRFEHFYARSKTEMTGGFSGLQKTVAPNELSAARAGLNQELRDDLVEEARAQVPDGFVIFDDGILARFTSLPHGRTGSSDTVDVKQRADVQVVMFDKDLLSRFIAENTVGGYDGSPVTALDLDDLSFSFTAPSEIDNTFSSFRFNLAGSTRLVWIIDEQRLIDDLAGKKKSESDMVLSAYPSIVEAEMVVRPFWKRNFPEKPSKIKVIQIINE